MKFASIPHDGESFFCIVFLGSADIPEPTKHKHCKPFIQVLGHSKNQVVNDAKEILKEASLHIKGVPFTLFVFEYSELVDTIFWQL